MSSSLLDISTQKAPQQNAQTTNTPHTILQWSFQIVHGLYTVESSMCGDYRSSTMCHFLYGNTPHIVHTVLIP